MPYPDRTQPENLNGAGHYRTDLVRGIGFAPTKKAVLVLPPDITSPEQLESFVRVQEAKGLDCSTLWEQLEAAD